MPTLKATQGSDELNDGTSRFPVERDGTVEVPEDVAARALAGGGFVEVIVIEPAPAGWVRVKHADENAGCSWGGMSFEVGKDGYIIVPAAATTDLAAHGFEPFAGEVPEPETPAEGGRKKPRGRKSGGATDPADEPETPAEE